MKVSSLGTRALGYAERLGGKEVRPVSRQADEVVREVLVWSDYI